jgi:ATP adenylyltransferase
MKESACIFCDPPSDRVFARNDRGYALWDAFPVTPLHALIIPCRHIADYFSISPQELIDCDELIRRARDEVMARDSTVSGFNIGVNAGSTAGQTIFHCHIHLIPRRHGDVPNPRGGIRHLIPGKGNY